MALVFNPLARETSYAFLSARHITLALSTMLLLVSVVSLFAPGLNLGIDFLGGTQGIVPVRDGQNLIDIQKAIQAAHPFLSGVEVQAFDDKARFIMPQPDPNQLRAAGVNEAVFNDQRREDALIALGLRDDDPHVAFETTGGQISEELQRRALVAVMVALIAIAAYIALRFEWRFSAAALIALVHDATTTIGLFALLGLEINVEVVAAVLTISGYSINDTVVVFDRIREEMRRSPDEPLLSLLNRSLNRTLSRTLITSVTTLLALMMLFWFAGADVREFSIALIWGVIVGTYSSLFLATPLLKVMGLSSSVFEKQAVNVHEMEDSALAWASKIDDTSVETLAGETTKQGSTPKRIKGKSRKGKKR